MIATYCLTIVSLFFLKVKYNRINIDTGVTDNIGVIEGHRNDIGVIEGHEQVNKKTSDDFEINHS